MKISESKVASLATRHYQQVAQKSRTESIFRNIEQDAEKKSSKNATLSISKEGLNELKDKLKELKKENEQKSQDIYSPQPASVAMQKDPSDIKLEALKKILRELSRWRNGKRVDDDSEAETESKSNYNTLPSFNGNMSFSLNLQNKMTVASSFSVSGTGSISSATFTREVKVSSFFHEEEVTSYSTTGKVVTESGREIEFNLSLEMSRSFTSQFEMEYSGVFHQVDPLIINVNSEPTSVNDMTFYFDLDCDGKNEKLHELNSGNGFLALDKNGDGKINDGSELFGPQSGDGFSELAKYDDDGNGWIDENDDVFKNLKIWMKNDDGSSSLISLKDADIGAIFLGAEDTQFSLNNSIANTTYANIRKTSFFLKENGGVGTIQHVDYMT